MISLRSLAMAASLALISSAALAADLPGHAAPAAPSYSAPTAAFSWAGFYFGNYVGDGFGPAKATNNGLSKTLNMNGATVGGYGGYNYQINSLVLGVEGDFGYDGASGHANVGNADNGAPVTGADKRTYDARARARVGYAYGNMLFFGAGGWTLSDEKVSSSWENTGGNQRTVGAANANINGFNLGLGMDYAITNNWVLRGEYIYDQFSPTNFNIGYTTPVKASLNDNTIRIGAAVKF